MLMFEFLSDRAFVDVPLPLSMLYQFMTRFLTYLQRATPPLTGEYTRVSYTRVAGCSIKWGPWVSQDVKESFNHSMFSGTTFIMTNCKFWPLMHAVSAFTVWMTTSTVSLCSSHVSSKNYLFCLNYISL